MNSIQKYVLNSLFVRNQITEEKLAQALDTFSNEPAIDAFLSVLITGEETKRLWKTQKDSLSMMALKLK